MNIPKNWFGFFGFLWMHLPTNQDKMSLNAFVPKNIGKTFGFLVFIEGDWDYTKRVIELKLINITEDYITLRPRGGEKDYKCLMYDMPFCGGRYIKVNEMLNLTPRQRRIERVIISHNHDHDI